MTIHSHPLFFFWLLFFRSFRRTGLGSVAGFRSGDPEGVRHGGGGCHYFPALVFVGHGQRLELLPSVVGAQWSLSALPTSVLPSAFAQYTGI